MNYLLKITASLILFLLTISSVNAQKNLIDEKYSSFENDGEGWQKSDVENVLFFSNMRAKTGKSSFKYSLRSNNSIREDTRLNIAYEGDKKNDEDSNIIKLKSGTYAVEAYFWIDNTSPNKAAVKLRTVDKSKGKDAQVKFDLTTPKKREWVKLTETFTVKKTTTVKLSIIVSTTAKNGGTGVFYLDDLSIYKK